PGKNGEVAVIGCLDPNGDAEGIRLLEQLFGDSLQALHKLDLRLNARRQRGLLSIRRCKHVTLRCRSAANRLHAYHSARQADAAWTITRLSASATGWCLGDSWPRCINAAILTVL